MSNFNKRPIVSIAILVVVKSEGNQDLSEKSSECKIYAVLTRNIKKKLSPLIDYVILILNKICLIMDDIRNSSC